MDDDLCHQCRPLMEALEDLRLSRLLHAMRPYMLSSPAPRPTVHVPAQRSRTAAEAEERLFHNWPRLPRRDVNNNRGGR